MDSPQDDDFVGHYTDRIRELIPAVYWNHDNGTLAALVGAVAVELSRMRRSHDRTWENQSAELADDWAIAYLADLLAVRPVPSLDARGRRIAVAKAIAYRRRSGTRQVLEEVAGDVSDWPTVAREAFLRLLRTPHRLELPAGPAAVPLQTRRAAFLRGTPFELGSRVPDVRRTSGERGLFNLPKVLLHQYTTPVHVARGVTPGTTSAADGSALSTFDPSGRRVPLFGPGRARAVGVAWRSAHWSELPTALRCAVLNDESYSVDDAVIEAARALSLGAAELRALTRMKAAGVRVGGRRALRRVLANGAAVLGTGAVFEALRRAALDEDCGRGAFLVGQMEQPPAIVLEDGTGSLDPHEVEGADLDGASPPSSTSALVDPEAGLFRATDIERTSYVYGWPGPVGAAHYAKAAPSDDATDTSTGEADIDGATLSPDAVLEVVGDATHLLRGPVTCRALTIRARVGSRPHVRLDDDVVVTAVGDEATLVLDGLWLGASAARRFVLRGDFERVVVRHCTFDPGDLSASASLVELVVEGSVESLEIANCLVGCLTVNGGFVASLVVTQCGFLPVPGRRSIETGSGTMLQLTGSTVTGAVVTHRLRASDTIFSSGVSTTDLQNGCVRYSAAPEGEALPRPYRVVRLESATLGGLFSSTSLGAPELLRLAARAPAALRKAASDGGETGLWGLRRDGAKLESVAAKVEEFLPVGLIAAHLRET